MGVGVICREAEQGYDGVILYRDIPAQIRNKLYKILLRCGNPGLYYAEDTGYPDQGGRSAPSV